MKFNESCSKGPGDMEWIKTEWLNHMTLKCDIDIESA